MIADIGHGSAAVVRGMASEQRPHYARAMPSGALSLGDFPGDVIRVACSKCDRAGRYRKRSLIAIHGDAVSLPDLLGRIAVGCPKRQAFGNDLCGAFYPDLVKA